jgi:hypothetical protein
MILRPSPQCGGHLDQREMYGAFATFVVTIPEANTPNNCYF